MNEQLAFEFALPSAAPIPTRMPTPIADKLIGEGLIENDFILSINRALTNKDTLPAPSRLYNFPIGYDAPDEDCEEAIYLFHPALAELPFVKRVETALGSPILYRPHDRFGRPTERFGTWWHAVDLMTDKHFAHLLSTQHLTTRKDLLNATSFGLEYGHLSVANARTVLTAIQQPEPKDRSLAKLKGDGLAPGYIDIDHSNGKKIKKPFWVPNVRRFEQAPWMIVHGLEDGWLALGKGGHLRLSDKAILERGLNSMETSNESTMREHH